MMICTLKNGPTGGLLPAVSLPLLFLLLCLMAPAPLYAAQNDLPTGRYALTLPHGKIKASWQKSGVKEIDGFAEQKVKQETEDFRNRLSELETGLQAMNMEIPPCELNITAAISSGGKTIGVLWAVYEFLGGSHGVLNLETRIYSVSPLKDGKRNVKPVRLSDLFRNVRSALEIFSSFSREELLRQGFNPSMVEPGTAPVAENFKLFLLNDQGLTLFFEPYQVAAWADGTIRLNIPLDKLKRADPVLSYWKSLPVQRGSGAKNTGAKDLVKQASSR